MSNTVRYVVIGVVCLLVLVLAYFGLTGREPVEVDGGYRVVMGTFARVVVIAGSERVAQACVDAAVEQQRRIDTLMSYHNPESQLSQVNRLAYAEPVAVSPETFEVLRRAVEFSKLSNGAFDVTVGPLGDLWQAAAQADENPTEQALAEARAKVGYEKLLLDEQARTVRFAVEGMKVDLGGIAKGAAIDASIEAMKSRGALGGMVDIGGDVRCFGQPPRGQESWRIGLQNPNVAPDELDATAPLLVLDVSDQAVTTSGDYRRFTMVKGQKQSHIMDAVSGKGADKLVSVTIIAQDATSADALATAVSVLGLEKGLALIEQVPATEAILIPNQPNAPLIKTSGAEAYIE